MTLEQLRTFVADTLGLPGDLPVMILDSQGCPLPTDEALHVTKSNEGFDVDEDLILICERTES